MSSQSNPERTVKCPVDGCGAEKLARGIHLHVRQSKGGGHGPQGEVPEKINLENLETVGKREVSIDYPDTRETEQIGRLCPYCERVFRGKQGAMIHLGRTAGKGPHPENPKKKVNAEDLAIVHVNEEGEVVETVKEPTVLPTTQRRLEREKNTSLKNRVRAVVKEFRQQGKDEAADRLEEILEDA